MSNLLKELKYNFIELHRKIARRWWLLTHVFKINRYIIDIPDGLYCYEILEYLPNGAISTRLCPFHKHLYTDLCVLNGTDCYGDSCKTCGINENFEDIWEDVYEI